MEPATPSDAKGLLKAAIRDEDPVLFFEHKFLYRRIKEEVPEGDVVVPIGKALVRREGRDATIVTFGAMVHTALEAARQLEQDGVSVEIVDLRTLAPIDRETVLASVARTSRVLLLHEATLTGGIGGELAAIIGGEGFEYLDAPIARLGSLDAPVPYAPSLEAAFLPNAAKVVEAVKTLVKY
ncbi:MAG TPA: transketolase C-terminal domain-containing protein [Vicinamibacterales bacterium]|nr:transketolase C-terminal domain-containing protein [Vicinamibacterales bacterium]